MQRAEAGPPDLDDDDDAFVSLESNTAAVPATAATAATSAPPLYDTQYGAISLEASAGHDTSNTAQQPNARALGRQTSAVGLGVGSGAGAGAAGHRRSISRRLGRLLPSAANFSPSVEAPSDTLPIRELAMSFEGLTMEKAAAKKGDSSDSPPLNGSRTAPAALPGAKAAAPRTPAGGSRHKPSKAAAGLPDLEDADPYKGLHSAIEEEEEEELMIGEIKKIDMSTELLSVSKFVLMSALILVPCVVYNQVTGGRKVYGMNLLWWAVFVVASILSLPITGFLARTFAYLLTHHLSSLLYKGNGLYFCVALHAELGLFVWSLCMMLVWTQVLQQHIVSAEAFTLISRLLSSFFAFRCGWLLKNFITLMIATRYLWKPYLQRVRSSIFAQYALLILTDFCTKGYFSKDDEEFAIKISDGKLRWGHLSLYAVSKAIHFIPRHKLGHTFFKQLGMSETLDSSNEARLLGTFLFESIYLRSCQINKEAEAAQERAERDKENKINGSSTAFGWRAGSIGPHRGSLLGSIWTGAAGTTANTSAAGSTSTLLASTSPPPPPPATAVGGPLHTVQLHNGQLSDHSGGVQYSSGSTADATDAAATHAAASATTLDELSLPPPLRSSTTTAAAAASAAATAGAGACHSSTSSPVLNGSNSSSSYSALTGIGAAVSGSVKQVKSHSIDSGACSPVPAAVTGHRSRRSSRSPLSPKRHSHSHQSGSKSPVRSALTRPFAHSFGFGEDKRGPAATAVTATTATATAEEVPAEPAVDFNTVRLKLETFCPLLSESMQQKVFGLFDADGSGDITVEEVVAAVVHIYKDHQSLALTLNDSQQIARKLAQLVGCLILFVLVFVWMGIFGKADKSITFASFLVGFAFMIGPASANLVEAVIFVFVMRPYDVGDRVYHWLPENSKMQSSIVMKIDLLCTKFKSWDEKIYYLPNHVLAKRTVINIQRSSHQWHEFFIQIAANTPSEKIWELKRLCLVFAKQHDTPAGLYPHTVFSMVGIEDSSKLTLRICFRQKSNWQIGIKKWATQTLCVNCIRSACEELGITYSMPELAVNLKQKIV